MTISGTPVLTSTSTSSPCIPTPADLTPFRAAEKYFKSRFNSTPAPGNVNGSSVTVTEKQRRKAAKAISSGSPLDQIPYEWLGYPLLTCQGVLDLSRPELNGDGGKEAEDEVKRAGWRTDDSPFAGRTMKKIEVTKLVEKDGEKAFEEGRAYMKKEGQSSWSEDREGSLRTENKTGWIIGDGKFPNEEVPSSPSLLYRSANIVANNHRSHLLGMLKVASSYLDSSHRQNSSRSSVPPSPNIHSHPTLQISQRTITLQPRKTVTVSLIYTRASQILSFTQKQSGMDPMLLHLYPPRVRIPGRRYRNRRLRRTHSPHNRQLNDS